MPIEMYDLARVLVNLNYLQGPELKRIAWDTARYCINLGSTRQRPSMDQLFLKAKSIHFLKSQPEPGTEIMDTCVQVDDWSANTGLMSTTFLHFAQEYGYACTEEFFLLHTNDANTFSCRLNPSGRR
jgi:hypothetical protein